MGHRFKGPRLHTQGHRYAGGHNYIGGAQEVAKGSQIYEVADHGGLMVLADNMRKTDSVKYTWNEGLTFTDLKFGDEPMEVFFYKLPRT